MEQTTQIKLSEHKKTPPKPWGRRERLIVFTLLALTVLTSAFLAASARSFKLPGLKISLSPSLSLRDLFKGGTIIIGNKKPDKSTVIQNSFVEKTRDLSGIYALYVVDLENGSSFGVNEGKVMRAASLIKLPVMLYAQGKVEETKIEAMGKRSDNTVFNQLVNQFGKDNLQNYIASLGMAKTSLTENQTTPKETGDLLAKIYQDKNEKILDYLTNTIFENWLRAGIPSEIRVSHKYGREVHVVNDAGIIFTNKPFVLVIMTDGVVETEADKAIPELAEMIYLLHAENQKLF